MKRKFENVWLPNYTGYYAVVRSVVGHARPEVILHMDYIDAKTKFYALMQTSKCLKKMRMLNSGWERIHFIRPKVFVPMYKVS